MRNRISILAYSLKIERLTSAFLAALLEIKEFRSSNTLGNSSNSISFNQKINLLIDLGALNRKEKSKFQTFMEIRNQFAHNIDAVNFSKCFDFIKSKDVYLLKLYPQEKSLSREHQLKKACLQLCEDVHSLTKDITKKIAEKNKKKMAEDLMTDLAKSYHEGITAATDEMGAILKKIGDDEPIFKSKVTQVLSRYKELIFLKTASSLAKKHNI